ncbi:pyruvate formate lyase activating enzyme [Rhodobacter sp. 140A]|jgi:pyruvate formate lyase activating enzyme|uniref:Anaerobic ribonucleoside-triphosphate reductase activating protein n=1 Tax=Paenirhodobacter hankyongi TaxID=2294033 RepID=A0A421BJH5_9RHOB|nr:anaerobic ribonucleoside-triphosphate reductase activating protein [Sinirhodobacter hankyongi]RBP83340.1 pyruvate formate lyase activating enzyme [Rhodobacter sp. 140A]RLL61982.1 anaerobic ribonucleoside-triphosphate reductase activating protein [Sinirhodobacter hankyongi]
MRNAGSLQSPPELRVGGLSRLSACDWPGELVATVFCQGCPWDCAYCHNPHLIPATGGTIPWPGVLAFLEARRGLLDAVVFSGGEPTLQAALPDAIRTVRAMGFRIGLHSAGPYPDRLAQVLSLIDWIGFDVKAAFDDYDPITRTPGGGPRARRSLAHVLASGLPCDIRTTVHDRLLDGAALDRLARDMASAGVPDHRLQPFRAAGCINPDLCAPTGDTTCSRP